MFTFYIMFIAYIQYIEFFIRRRRVFIDAKLLFNFAISLALSKCDRTNS